MIGYYVFNGEQWLCDDWSWSTRISDAREFTNAGAANEAAKAAEESTPWVMYVFGLLPSV